jgi:tRNA modification GTPase
VAVLTPPGVGAIATVAVTGPRAWELARRLFRPASKAPLPESPPLNRFWFGTLGDGAGDEVILAVTRVEPEVCIEVHSHGGRRVVRWVVELFQASEGRQPPGETITGGLTPPARLLPSAPTLRTAAIVLDQLHGVFDRAVRAILAKLDAGEPTIPELDSLAAFAPVGRHLVDPWTVVIAGPPNVGKSSLVNALAGYQRAVVSEVAGTTRDVVTVPVAFDGWPVELADTAGLRAAAGLEAEGIGRAERFIRDADLVLWVLDATAPRPALPERPGPLLVVNKVDQPTSWDVSAIPDTIRISAVTGEGVAGLAAVIARSLVPNPPYPGAAVPYTPQLAGLVEAAHAALTAGRTADATALFRSTVAADPPTT